MYSHMNCMKRVFQESKQTAQIHVRFKMQRTCPTAVDFDAIANLPIRTALSPQYHLLRTLPAAAAQRLDGRETGNRAGRLEGESPAHRSRALESESCQIERAKTVRGAGRRGWGGEEMGISIDETER